MVTSVTSFARSGVADWLLQRFTAVILVAWTLCVAGFVLMNPELDYTAWHDYFAHPVMKVFSMMALVSLVAHAWIGLWSVSTDYITVRMMGPRADILRLAFQAGYALLLFAYLVWGIEIFWG